MKTEYYTESVPYTDQVCESKQLAYSITDFTQDSICLDTDERCTKYFLGICTEKETFCVSKTIYCHLILNNLDQEKSGTWAINFMLREGSSIFTQESYSYSLYPQTPQEINKAFSLSGEENCKKTLTCSYLVTTIPTKQVCRDVIKYKEVQRERQVTAYRPVTKYKTERQCN